MGGGGGGGGGGVGNYFRGGAYEREKNRAISRTPVMVLLVWGGCEINLTENSRGNLEAKNGSF